MPLLKYYCDYCEKQFQDTPSARKRHLQGLQHQHAKALYYQNSSSSSSFLAQNHQIHPSSFGKGVCNRFLRTGSCQYGDSCKYYHPKQNFQSLNPQGIPENIQSPSIAESQLVGGGPFPGGRVRDSMGISLGNLPPSLKPPPEGGYAPLPFIDWG